jgi:hypothetical protein
MEPMPDRRVRLIVHALAGSMLVLLAVFADPILGRPRAWGTVESLTLAAGVVVVLSGVVLRTGRLADLAALVCLPLIAGLGFVAIAEGTVRLLGIDIARPEQAWLRVAPYYRQPTVPIGEAFFRRLGPEEWTGQVINTQMNAYRVTPNPYADERVITVRYDSLGFRAAGTVHDWEIAVAGNSFTELGSLTDDELHTTILGERLGVRIRNLGVSQTGPLTHLTYLESFGVAPSTRHVMIMFFEGNDLWDLKEEFDALLHWRETGEREYRVMEGGNSILRTLDSVWRAHRAPPIGPDSSIQAYFRTGEGEVPMTLVYSPASAADVLADEPLVRALDYFFASYAGFAESEDVTPWLVYMPVKLRAMHGQLRFTDRGRHDFGWWTPTDLPELIGDYAARHGIGFIDVTPALATETARARETLYYTIYDTHLNPVGSRVVAEEIARQLSHRATDLRARD